MSHSSYLSLNTKVTFLKLHLHIVLREKPATLHTRAQSARKASEEARMWPWVILTFYILCLYPQALVRQASYPVRTAAASLQARAATSRMTVATARMRRTVARPAPSRTASAVAGGAPRLTTSTGCLGPDPWNASGLHTTTPGWMRAVRIPPLIH